MAKKNIEFKELGLEERKLLLSAYDYDVDEEGYIISPTGERIASEELPLKFLKVDSAMLIVGSLDVRDSSPTVISKFIRERIETSNDASTI